MPEVRRSTDRFEGDGRQHVPGERLRPPGTLQPSPAWHDPSSPLIASRGPVRRETDFTSQ
jgi:hypothetical protein